MANPLTRRLFTQSAAVLPAAVAGVARELSGAMDAAEGAKYFYADRPSPTTGIDSKSALGMNSPKMLEDVARKMALSDPTVQAFFEEDIYRRTRRIAYIDPDLLNKRSFSDAAKICFQRQRDMQRMREQYATTYSDDPNRLHWTDVVHRKIQELMWGGQ